MVRLLFIAVSIVGLDLLALYTLYKILRLAFLRESDLVIGGQTIFQSDTDLITPFIFLVLVYVVKNVITYFL